MTAPHTSFTSEDGTPFVVGESLPKAFNAPHLRIVSLHVVDDGLGLPGDHVEVIALHSAFYDFVSSVLRDGGAPVLSAYLTSMPKLAAATTNAERDAITAEAFEGFDASQQALAHTFAVEMQKIGQGALTELQGAAASLRPDQRTQANILRMQQAQQREMEEAVIVRVPVKNWRHFVSRISIAEAVDTADDRLTMEAAFGGQASPQAADEGSEGEATPAPAAGVAAAK